MNELPWATPEALGKLTLSQLLCLGHEKEPGHPKPCESFEEYLAEMAKIEDEENRWSQS